jgi:hypothetical protein
MGIGKDGDEAPGWVDAYLIPGMKIAGGAALTAASVVAGGLTAETGVGAVAGYAAAGMGVDYVMSGIAEMRSGYSARQFAASGPGATPAPGPSSGAPGAQGAGELKDGVAPYVPAGLVTNGKQGKGLISKDLADKLFGIAGTFPGATITSLNDSDIFPDHDASKSKHGQGKAIDFVPQDKDWFKYKDYYVSQLTRGLGFPFAQAEEKGHKSANGNTASGAHLHAELANGGVTRGPSLAGEAGPEAVIPLPDGRRIPVKMDTSDLIDKLNELLSVMKDQLDTSDKIHRAVA